MPLLTLLLVEDSEPDATRVLRALTDVGHQVEATRVDTAEALVAELSRGRWDVAIADYTLKTMSGERALAIVREHAGDLPFIFVSGTGGEDVAVEAMRIGAQDYIMKDSLDRLAPAIERELREAEARRERRRHSERVAYLAYHDELTDLPNRTLLNDRLHQGILAAKRDGRPLSLMALDLDGFKEINDSLGHHAGDRVLQLVAARLRTALRESDTVARLGGDEFAVLLLGTDAAGAELAATKILQELEAPMLVEGRPLFVSASVGIAVFPEHGSGEHELLQKADISMYVAKNDRSGFSVYAADRDGRAEQRLALVSAMWYGLEREQFSLDYQPIVDLRTDKISALEALIRWNHPVHGRLPPDQFIQIAEHSGLVTQLTTFAINRALSEWPCGSHGLMVAVNLSPRSLHDGTFPGRVRELIATERLEPSCLALEITENVIMSDPERAVRHLRELHEMGVKLVMDDFGTGYSSLAYLRRLPVSQLKIDRSFIAGLTDGEDEALVRSIIDLAHNLKLEVVAEGVDSAAVCERLRMLGCDMAQGHFISAPGPAAEIVTRVMERAGSRPEAV
ncbi:MAG TPA: EAL domain-containing protein [Vicinamibacterales bacterium]|nr:EAL domain-containing protein [Vicinamibacterales bacterium]